MKKSFITSLMIAGLLLAFANSVFATIIITNPANVDISADLAAVGGSGGYLTTNIAIQEGSNRDIANGTIILTVATNFQFNTAATVSVSVTRGSGTGGLVGLNSANAIVTISNMTITVTNQDAVGSTTSRITWSNVQLRPLYGTPLATNTITMATNSTATILGITKGVTSFGQLREVVGAANKLGYTTAPAATNTAGVAFTNVVVQVQDRFGNTISSNNVAVGLTLNTGTFASGNTNATTGAGGSATLSNLVMNTAGSYTLTASAAATSLSNSLATAFIVVPAAPSTLQILQDAPASVFAGVTFPSNVTVLVADAFANPVSNKTVTLSLLGGGTLNGTTSQPSDGNGIATFSGLSVAQAGSQSLVASISSPSLSTTGTAFTVNAGFASQLGYTIAPATTTAGVTMSNIVVQIQDQAGNSIASNGVPITVTLNVGGFTSGTTTVNTAPDGSATFSDLLINTSGNYTLTASAASTTFSSTPAAPFTIAPGAPSVFQITQDAPASTTAGTVFSPAVTVLVTDSLNNPITNKTVTLTLLGGGTLNGTASQPTAVNGVAAFGDLNITVPGASYALVAAISGPSLSVTGNTFAVTTAAASKLVYTSVPATTNTAGSTLSGFGIQITDAFGNAIPTNGVQITMSLANGTFASGTTTSNSDVNGSASFGDLVITNAGNNTLTASAPGLASANDALVILPATFAMTFQQDAPSPATAGVTFSPPVAVRIADQYNNLLTNKTVTLTLLGGGSLTGTLSQATSASGVASFNNLAINLAGTNYSLVAAISSPSLSVTGATFTVNTAPPSKLVFTSVPPAITNAGSQLSSFGIQIQDPFNNNVLTNGVLITMTLSNGTFASGTTSTNSDVNGSASIGDLVITNAGNNTVTASASGLTSANKALVILPAPYAITFQQDAPAVTNAGAVFTPAVTVKLADQYNNVLSNRIVTLTLLNGGGPLVGLTSQSTTNTGVATFTNLTINVAGTNYALVATTNALGTLSVTGQTFTVTAAAPTKLAYTGTPATTNIAGATLSSFVVQVQDQFSNAVPTNGVPISMTLSNGTFASGTTSTNTDPTGSVTIGDLVITNAGNNRVIASSAGLTSTNKIMVITPATLSIALLQDAPAVTNAGAVFTPAVTVKLADQFNNVISNRTVTMSVLNGSLSGTTAVSTTTNGVATFSTLNVTTPGTNYALVASSTNSLSVTGATFTITVGAPSKLMYTTLPPSTAVAGIPFSAFIVQIEDSLNNPISTNGVPITLTLNTGSFGSGTTNTISDPDGSKTFGDVAINNVGTYTMAANSPGLTSAFRIISVAPTNASIITFVQQPPAVTNAGMAFSPAVAVKITDQYSNPITNTPITVSLNGAGALNGTLTHNTATNGIATFTGLSVPTPGTGYSLMATSGSLSTNSSNFDINVGPNDHYLVTATPPVMRGNPFNVVVTAQDVASNTVTADSSTVVTMSTTSLNLLFDGSGDNTFTNNTGVLSNGSFTISTIDDLAETTTITATDPSNKTGSASITINSATGDYRSATNGNWSVVGTWQVWDGTNWVAASVPPAGGAGTNITIQSTHTVSNNAPLTLMGRLTTQGSLSFTSGGTLTVGDGGIVRNSGTINSTANSLIFSSGGLYRHAYSTTAGTVPTATWSSNSTCAIIGYTTFASNPGGFNQSFYNFLWNCPNQTSTISAGGTLTTVNGNFTVVSTGSGTLQGANTVTLHLTVSGDVNLQNGRFIGSNSGSGNFVKIGGSYVQTGGTFSEGSSAMAVIFAGVNKNFIRSGGTINNVNLNFAVTNGASLMLNNSLSVSNGQTFVVFNTGTLNCGTNVISGAGSFVLNSGGALGIGSTDGVASAGSVGNIQTTTRTLNTGGVYIYNGLASQTTGSGLPGTVSSLIVSNTGGIVTLGSSPVVTSNLTVSAGVFDLGGFTANRASNGGTVTVANGAALKVGGTNTFPTNYLNRVLATGTVEYEGSAQSVAALPYGTLNTSGSGTKTLLAGSTSIAGDLNIGVGTTFNAVTNSFSISGNLTNNGTAFAFSGPQTVTFTGSGTQNVSGASATAFNTFAIGSASVIDLDDNDTALEFTIAGLDQAGGTWGSTASGATNPDDANFLGLGTLDVTPPTFGMSFLQDAPAVTNAGAVFSPAVVVQLTSSATNLIGNQTVTLTLNGGGVLGGTTSHVTDTNGLATFANLFINAAGTNYSLTASIATPSLSVTGNTFIVTTASATKLAYIVSPPATTIAGATVTNFTVQIQDQFNNSVAVSGVPITMSLNSGTFASGTPVINSDVNGSATFSDLVITNAGNRTLIASSPGLTSANSAITVSPDVANSTIAFVQGPAATIAAGAVFTNTVQIVDEFNNGISGATITLSPNGFATLNGTTSHVTAANGVATFNNLSVNTPGTGYSLTASATNNSLSTTSSSFDVLVGAINHYLVSATTPQTRGVAFPVTVTAQDSVGNTVPDSTTVVTMNSSTLNVQFDANGDSNFVDNTQTLSNGTFVISTLDNIGESVTITARDASNHTGSASIVVDAAGGDYRSIINGLWNNTNTWQVWDGANWVSTNATPAGGAGTNITIQSGTRAVTDNVAIALSGTLVNQGTLAFTSGSIAVGSGGLVQNSGSIVGSATTLLFNSGGTYQHAENGGTIPTATYNTNSLLRVTGITGTIVTLPTSVSGSVEWNSPNQTVAAAIILSSATTIGGDFDVISTGTGSIIDGGTTARNLTVGGNMTVQGGTYYAIGGNGSSAGNVTVSVASNLTISGGNFSMVVGQGGTSSFNVSGTLIVGGDLAMTGGTLAILTNNTYTSSAASSMTVSGNTSIAGGLLDLSDATNGNASGVTATLRGNLSIAGGTISRKLNVPATVNFAGTATQTYSKSGGTIAGAVNFAILQGATVNFGTALLDGSSGTFTLNAGGRIGLGDPAGITTSGPTGNIQVTGTRTYSAAGRYVYNGSAPQDTGNGLPSTVSSLTVSNSAATVTLDATVNVTSNLTITAGTLDLGSFTADRITSGGTITVANGTALKIGGANTFPANFANLNLGTNSTVEYEGSGQSVTNISYGNLVTSGSGSKTLLTGATTITNLTIGAGTTFDAGTNDFSVTGDWSNNGSFTATNTQSVTFAGASPQTIDGSVATTFNNVAINTGSKLNLAIDGSTAQFLTIGAVTQTTGTYGATGSGATHIDDADFLGTGTLNVLASLTSPSTTTVVTSGSPSIYGQPVTFTASVAVLGGTPPATGTVTFMAGANTLGTQVLSGSPTGTAAFVTGALLPGTYTITAVYGGDANFLASSNSVAQEVDVAPLTITANSTTKTYGQTLSFAGTEFIASGLTNGDSVTSVTLTSGGTVANATAGNYSIIPSAAIGTGLANYTITYSNGTLMVNQASVTPSITASNKVYDGTTTATIASYGLTGVFSNDAVSLSGGTANFIDQNVGTNKSVTATGLILSGGDAGNYMLTSSNASTTADITPASLTISADNKTKTAGLPNPLLTATYTSFVTGDDTNALSTPVTLSTTATTNSPAGTYPITASGAVAANYTISYNSGTLTVVGVPQLTNTKVVGNQFIFSFATVSNENYQVEFKTDLHAPTWTNSGGLIAGTGNTISVTNAITSSAVFYRVEVSPGN